MTAAQAIASVENPQLTAAAQVPADPRGHESGRYGFRKLFLAGVGVGLAEGWGLGEVGLPSCTERSPRDPLRPAGAFKEYLVYIQICFSNTSVASSTN